MSKLKEFLQQAYLSEKKFQILLLIFILLPMASYHLLPYMGIYGSDLSMQFFFHHCEKLQPHAANLFELAGDMCNDPRNTHYAYPVLIFRFFSFLKYFDSFQPFYILWSSLIALTLLFQPFFWLQKYKKTSMLLIYFIAGILSLIQAPSYFAIERGGTDIVFLIPWMIAAYFGIKNKWFLSGIFMSLAALLKVYPAMAIMPIMLGLLFEEKSKTHFIKCAAAGIITAAIIVALDLELWKTFILTVIPYETKFTIGTNAIGHSLIGPFSKIFVYPVMIMFWWLFAQLFALKNYKKLAFAGTLALSTYFNGHSFDYNLITFFPFFYLCVEMYFDLNSNLRKDWRLMWGIIILCLTILGPSNFIFGFFKFTMRVKLLLELFSYALIIITILKTEKSKILWYK